METRQQLTTLIASPEYQGAAPEDRRDLLRRVIRGVRSVVRKQARAGGPDWLSLMQQEMQQRKRP